MSETSADELLPIIQAGEPVLQFMAVPVDPSDLRRPDVQQLIARMRATMDAAPGVGLAAPQIGEPVQLAVMSDGPERFSHLSPADLAARERTELPFTVIVNPVLTPLDSDPAFVGFYEGCLSVPGLTGFVRRHRKVQVDCLDEHGEPRTWIFTGWPARIAQHEIDHLRGTLYLDRVETRSLSTVENYGELWAGVPIDDVGAALGFPTGGPRQAEGVVT